MKSETYKKILVAAANCFPHKGFSATSIGDIAKSAKLSQGAMYTHFASKCELIVAIVNEEMEEAIAAYGQPYTGSALERLLQLVRNCIMKNGYPIEPALWTEIMAEAARNPQIKASFISADIAMRAALKNILNHGIAQNEFHGIDAEESSIVLFALMDGLISRRAINPEFSLEQHLPALRQTIVSLLNYRT